MRGGGGQAGVAFTDSLACSFSSTKKTTLDHSFFKNVCHLCSVPY